MRAEPRKGSVEIHGSAMRIIDRSLPMMRA